MTFKEKVKLLTAAKERVQAHAAIQNALYEILLARLGLGDDSSILFDYVFNSGGDAKKVLRQVENLR